MEIQIDGIIVNSKNTGESGKTIEVLTDDGFAFAFANGARKLSGKYLPITQLFSIVQLRCEQSGSLTIIKDGKSLGRFSQTEKDINNFFAVGGVINALKKIVPEADNKKILYSLFYVYLQQMNQCDNSIDCIVSNTLKFYIYQLTLLDFDVECLAKEYKNGKYLENALQHLKGKKISVGMTRCIVFDDCLELFYVLRDIYLNEISVDLDDITKNIY